MFDIFHLKVQAMFGMDHFWYFPFVGLSLVLAICRSK